MGNSRRNNQLSRRLFGIVLYEFLKPTSKKVKQGDSVFVPINSLTALDPVRGLDDITAFTKGFMSSNVKVTNVITAGIGQAYGSIIGLSSPVRFALSSVTLIERNGKQFT